jgi:four helix bundle suffix protein
MSGQRGQSGRSENSGQRRSGATGRAASSSSPPPDKPGEQILGPHGGYRKLKSFQLAQLVYDLTVRFCDRYIDRRSRTHDQMVQAARSGVQNIAEGSEAAATSSKTELKLTQVARASLEELKLDYEDFLRHRGLPCWDRNHPLRQQLVEARLKTADEVAVWVAQKARQRCAEATGRSGSSGQSGQSGQSQQSEQAKNTPSTESTPSTFYPGLSANAILTLATVAGFLLDRQMALLAEKFEDEGGFTERLYRVRSARRRQP